MKNHSTLLKVCGGLLFAVLAFWLYSVSGAYFGDDSDGIEKTMNVCGIFESILIFSFFFVLKRDYPDNPNSKYALIFAGVASAMSLLSAGCGLWANSLEESLKHIQMAGFYDMSPDVLESKEHFIYLLEKAAHYLAVGSSLLIVAFVFALRLFDNNAKLTAAVAVYIFVYLLQYVNIYRPFSGDGEEWDRAYDLYRQRNYIWYILKVVLVNASYVFLMFTYADKDNKSILPKKGIQTVDWIAFGTILLTFVFFCKDWVCVGEGVYARTLIHGGYVIPLVAIGLIPIVWSAFSIFLNNYVIRVITGVALIVWPLFSFFVAGYHPVGDMEISLFEMADGMSELGMGFSLEGVKLVNFFAYLVLSIVSGALILNGSHKPAAPMAPAAPAPQPIPAAPAAPQENATEVVENQE